MKKFFLIWFLNLISILNATTLQELYDNAMPGEGYQKLIILEKDSIYTGGLIQNVESLCIHGNGAIIDLIGSSITVDGEDNILDINYCVIKSSSDTPNVFIEYKNNSSGKIINNTFWGLYNEKKASQAIFLKHCLKDTTIIINNIFSNFIESLFIYFMDSDSSDENHKLEIEYNLHWDCDTPYLVWGGWTGFPASFIPNPGNGELLNDPQLVAPGENNFYLDNESICIDNGTETSYEYQGYAPDIGALESSYSFFRGTELSGNITEDLIKVNSPYIIKDDIIIQAGEKILIEPGVEIKFNYLKSFTVHGELQITGTIADSIKITNNSCYDIPWRQILFEKNSSNSSEIKYTRIEYGSGTWNDHGAITCLNDSVSIFDCFFTKNQYAIYCGENSKVRISNNTFYDKPQFTGKRVIICAPSSKVYIDKNNFYASSIYSDSASLKLFRNKFMGQDYRVDQQYWLITLANKSVSYLESNLLKDNYGAILIKDSSVVHSMNNLITGCDNAMLFSDYSDGSITNNTIYSNGRGPFSYTDGYGITCHGNSKINISNSIVWNIGEWSKAVRAFESSEVLARYCAFSTEFEGEEIIYDDPLFSNPEVGDFHLNIDSPCIDSGDPDTSNINISSTDFEGKSRFVNGQIDMGCFEYQYPDNIDKGSGIVISDFTLEQNYPNPFNSVTVISFTISQRIRVILDIYDISGRKVRTLVNSYLEKGIHSLRFNAGNLSSGIYFYKLKTGNSLQQVKRMVHIQ